MKDEYVVHTNLNLEDKILWIKKGSLNSSLQLVEVTSDELSYYRNKGVPSFVLKIDSKLFWTVIPENISFFSSVLFGTHMCATGSSVCHRLSTASDEEGGCKKVREGCSGIEKYPWITKGYETFATKFDCFVVVECERYRMCPPRPKLSMSEKNAIKFSLGQMMWNDVISVKDLMERVRD